MDQPDLKTPRSSTVPVESLRVGDRVLVLGTVEDILDPSDLDATRASVRLEGDEMGDAWTSLRLENVVYRASELERGKTESEWQQEVADLRRQLEHQRQNNERRNRQLDALGIVWCDGGCDGGMLRYAPDREVTAQMVAELIINAHRALSWYLNHAGKMGSRQQAGDAIRALLPPHTRDLRLADDDLARQLRALLVP